MAEIDSTHPENDYTRGAPRPHHKFYFPDGSIVIKVEQAIFKVSKYVLSKHSNVIKDMMCLSGDTAHDAGVDENPLLLVGDSVEGWELIPTQLIDIYNDPRLYKFFTLAHKYSMEIIEKNIISHLEKCNNVQDATSLLVLSQVIESTSLYNKAKEALVEQEVDMTIRDSEVIGARATYEILMARNKKAINLAVKM
ncbi:7780_t:CDS:2, partial [Acaulospora colombiana]